MIYFKIEEVAKSLNISISTVKKYYLLIEKYGYRFHKNNQGNILFTEKDIRLFRQIIKLKNEPGIKVEDAIKKVISSITDITVIDEDITIITNIKDTTSQELKVIKDIIQQQNELLNNQQKQINQLLENQNINQLRIVTNIEKRDNLLMQSLKESQELKKILLEQKTPFIIRYFKSLFKNQ